MSSNEPPLGEEPKEVDQAALSDAEPASAFPIVGVGASAGGLAAFTKFLSNIPTDSGIAFVLVPHLDPTHESLMVELLGRETALPVSEAQNGEVIRPNHVYLIPPNRYLALRKGHLTLAARPNRHGSPTAIDYFFDSLATEQCSRAIGVILSGTSSHGTIGLKEIKSRGGMMIVQQPQTAEFDQMPANAIATGLVDLVLPPEQMAEAILKYRQAFLRPRRYRACCSRGTRRTRSRSNDRWCQDEV
jgi:two-component system, chemotaxis family, CheB/CheR fusion protein